MMGRFRTGAIAGAMLAVVALCAGAGDVTIEQTEAAWSKAEYASGGTISAATLVAPSNATCVPASVIVVGLQSVRLTWSSPQQGGQQIQIVKNGVTGTDVQGTAGSVITQTGNANNAYQYEATFSTAKLLGLVNLGDLLGGTYTIRIYNGYAGSTWISAPKTFQLNVVLLGLNTTCPAA
ncbi:hypothetical protein ACNPNP_10010 [Microbacterium sp. AGC85]